MILTSLAGAVDAPVMPLTRYGLSDDGLSDLMKSLWVIYDDDDPTQFELWCASPPINRRGLEHSDMIGSDLKL